MLFTEKNNILNIDNVIIFEVYQEKKASERVRLKKKLEQQKILINTVSEEKETNRKHKIDKKKRKQLGNPSQQQESETYNCNNEKANRKLKNLSTTTTIGT